MKVRSLQENKHDALKSISEFEISRMKRKLTLLVFQIGNENSQVIKKRKDLWSITSQMDMTLESKSKRVS